MKNGRICWSMSPTAKRSCLRKTRSSRCNGRSCMPRSIGSTNVSAKFSPTDSSMTRRRRSLSSAGNTAFRGSACARSKHVHWRKSGNRSGQPRWNDDSTADWLVIFPVARRPAARHRKRQAGAVRISVSARTPPTADRRPSWRHRPSTARDYPQLAGPSFSSEDENRPVPGHHANTLPWLATISWRDPEKSAHFRGRDVTPVMHRGSS